MVLWFTKAMNFETIQQDIADRLPSYIYPSDTAKYLLAFGLWLLSVHLVALGISFFSFDLVGLLDAFW